MEDFEPTPLSMTPGLWDREQYMNDNSFAINNKYNQEPDYNDPEWHKKVTDWSDFWNYQKWDLEVEGLEDDIDIGGNPVNSEQRVVRLFAAIKDIRLRGDVMQWMPPITYREHFNAWENPPVEPDVPPVNPVYSHNDLRAISEKRRWKDLMDIEWRRRTDQVGRLTYPDPYLDVRLDRIDYEIRSADRWTAEQWRALITMDGLGANPEDHQGITENPLIPVDFVQTMGVGYIEETEDFLESIGHLATPEEEARFNEEVIIDALGYMGLDGQDLLDEARAMEDDYEDDEDEDGEGGEYEDEDEQGFEDEGEQEGAEGIVEVDDGDGF